MNPFCRLALKDIINRTVQMLLSAMFPFYINMWRKETYPSSKAFR